MYLLLIFLIYPKGNLWLLLRPEERPREGFFTKLRKPLFKVGTKCVSLNSLASVNQYLSPKYEVPNTTKRIYIPPKKINKEVQRKASKLPQLDSQILNVLGYIRTVWKNKNSTIESSIKDSVSREGALTTKSMYIESQVGSLFSIKKRPTVSIKQNSMMMPTRGKTTKQVTKLKGEEHDQDMFGEEDEINRRKKVVSNVLNRIPDLEFLLLKSLVITKG